MRTSGKSIPEASRDLDLTESALRGWVQRAEAENSSPSELTAAERGELAGLMRLAGLAGRPRMVSETTLWEPSTVSSVPGRGPCRSGWSSRVRRPRVPTGVLLLAGLGPTDELRAAVARASQQPVGEVGSWQGRQPRQRGMG